MSVDDTAGQDDEAPGTAIRVFLTVRRTRSALAATVVSGALAAGLGSREAPVPTAVEHGQAVIPLWRLLAMAAAVLPVLALHSRLADLESLATRRLRHHQRLHLAAMGLGCALIYLGASATTLRPLVLLIIARSMLAWWGLALVAGALLGWRLAWTLPMVVAVVLWYWGYRGDGRYSWWEFTARPHDDLPSLLLSLGLFALGLVAYASTPWRRRRWTFWRGGGRGEARITPSALFPHDRPAENGSGRKAVPVRRPLH